MSGGLRRSARGTNQSRLLRKPDTSQGGSDSGQPEMMESVFFYFFGTISLLAAISVVVQRKVIYSAISLIVCLCSLSGIYLLLQAQFIAAVQVIVYAGAIMVLFLFVIMLLDPFGASILADKKKYLSYFAVFLGLI